MKQLFRWGAKFCLLLTALIMLFIISNKTVVNAAPKDTKKPVLTITPKTKKQTNQNIKVTVKATDSSGISSIKWASGTKKANYFAKSGTKITLKNNAGTMTIKKNGTYTFYAKDKAGNISTKKLVVENIDKTAPKITTSLNWEEDGDNIIISLNITDKDSGIAMAAYLEGKKEAADFKSAGTKIPLKAGKGTIALKKNQEISILAKDKAGNTKIAVVSTEEIDSTAPVLKPQYAVMNQEATVTVNASDKDSGIKQIMYIKGKETDPAKEVWKEGLVVANQKSFQVESAGSYSILAEDMAGNKTVKVIDVVLEMRAVWLSYLEFDSLYKNNGKNLTEDVFTSYFTTVADTCKEQNMNTIIVQVRPFGDAFYDSDYFPWSSSITGKQGVDPGFDPLEIMVRIAHDKGIAIHAWLNPYRITSNTTSADSLSKDNQAAKWMESSSEAKQRNVLSFGGKLYYNPAKTDAQNLIVNGVKEIVENYDVDGIHFDDYFYPSLGSSYGSNFDAEEYNQYKKQCSAAKTTPKTIVEWRRSNVDNLLKNVYSAIKKIDSSVEFGVSPQGSINNLYSNIGNYADVKKWMASDEYMDYICPQVYWSFDHPSAAYDKMVDEWIEARENSNVKLYIGIAVYKAGISKKEAGTDIGWVTNTDEMKNQIEYGRETGQVDGYCFYRYEFLAKARNSKAAKELENLFRILD